LVGFLLVLLAAVIVGCSDPPPSVDSSLPETVTSSAPAQPEIEAVWNLVTFEVDGVEEAVEIGVNTSNQPWIDLRNPYLTGSLGCNAFGGTDDTYTLVDGVLKSGPVFRTAAFCVNEGEDPTDEDAVMVTEVTFYGIFEQGIDGITVEVFADEMVWTAGNTRLTFSKAEEPPSG
jgi:hypothetical protein